MTTSAWSSGESDASGSRHGSPPRPAADLSPDPRRRRARAWQVAALAGAAVALVLAFLLRTNDSDTVPGASAAMMACAMIEDLDAEAVVDPAQRESALVALAWVSAAQSMGWVASLEDESYVGLREALNVPNPTVMRLAISGPSDEATDPVTVFTGEQFSEGLTGAQATCAETRAGGP